ncbi:MAG: hypothetical protein K6A94_04575 [Bacteroidales bacterium]|nr:hypothetical protein [Bacteroidales bacterium]
MVGPILLCVFLLIMLAISVWFAIRVKYHPEKDRGMRRVMEERRGAEYEAGMQKFFMANYVSNGVAWVVAVLIEIVFHLETFLAMWITGLGFGLMLNIAKWRFMGEFSKAGFVTFAIGLALLVVYLVVK